MFERFTSDARTVVKAAEAQARDLGSRTIEAEHLLLALAAGGAIPGLDRLDVLDALDAERTRSLLAAGVSGDVDLPPTAVRPRMAASAKLALERSLRAAVARSDRSIRAGHLLLGVLAAEAGTVPRALEIAGIDRDALRDAAFS